jgi:hypothetical protein
LHLPIHSILLHQLARLVQENRWIPMFRLGLLDQYYQQIPRVRQARWVLWVHCFPQGQLVR